MAPRRMILDLLATGEIIDEDVLTGVDAYLITPERHAVPIGENHWIDPIAAIAGHPFAHTLMRQPWASAELKRLAIQAALLMAYPEKN